MSKLPSLKKIFDDRHDFDPEEQKQLQKNWPKIKFVNIPTTWIVPIDDLLVLINSAKVNEIRQDYGHLTIISKGLSAAELATIHQIEQMIYRLDEDLHKEIKK